MPSYASAPDAGSGERIGAYLIDVLVIVVASFIPVAGLFLAPAYALTRDGLPFLDGQSIGKKVLGLRAVGQDGSSLSNNWGPAIVRNAVLFIPLFALVELIVLLTNEQHLRLGDQWAKTRVVRVK